MIRPGVYRVRGDKLGYSRISDTFARDGKLSARGRSVGLYMLSHREGFVMRQEVIARHLEISVVTLRGAFADLAERGYMRSGTARDGQRLIGTWYVIHDEQLTEEQWAVELADLSPGAGGGAGPEGTDSEHTDSVGTGSDTHKGNQASKGDHCSEGYQDPAVQVDQSDRLGIRARGSEAAIGRQRAREPDDHGETQAVIDTLRTRTGTAITDLHHVKKIIKQLLGDRPDVKDRVAYLIGAINKDDNPHRFLPTPTPPRFQRSTA